MWRNESRFLKSLKAKSTILNPTTKLKTVASQQVFKDESGRDIIKGYLGTSVLSAV